MTAGTRMLKENAAEDHLVHGKLARAVFCGVQFHAAP